MNEGNGKKNETKLKRNGETHEATSPFNLDQPVILQTTVSLYTRTSQANQKDNSRSLANPTLLVSKLNSV